MRAASKTVKRHSFIRRIFPQKINSFTLPKFGLFGMKRDWHRETPAGFTIIETLIVLAVTGMLFVIAFVQINGRQNETEFQQAINDLSSSLQQQINSVSSGDYQGAQQLQCDLSGPGGTLNITNYTGSNPDNEGTSNDCVFDGKIVAFYNAVGNRDRQYITYPVAGLRTDASGNDCTTIACVQPVVVAPSSNAAPGVTTKNFPDDGVISTILYGLTFYKNQICFDQGPNAAAGFFTCPDTNSEVIGGFGIMQGVGTSAGSQQLYLVPIRGTNPSHNSYDPLTSRPNTISWIDRNLQWSYGSAQTLVNNNAPYSVDICMVSGTTSQSGLIVIGGNGGDINSVQTKIFSSTTCT